jgi:predicted XRE-type DNA-binding protein
VSSRSSGNPFADLGMADADTRMAKAQLAQRITAVMRERGLNQVQIAEKLGIDQPQVSRITRGQLKDFSLDRLMALVKRLNQDIEITIRDNPEPSRPAQLVVTTESCYSELAIAASSSGHPKMQFD